MPPPEGPHHHHGPTGTLAYAAHEAADPFDGTQYEGLHRLRHGGMGEVWLVRHRKTRRRLAAKIIHPRLVSDPAFVARMKLEAVAMGQVRHEKVARVHDFAQTRAGRPFLVMEYLEGPTLADELGAKGPLPLADAVTFTIDLLAALGAIHDKGLVHRDIKPENLLICELPNGARCVKVLDFGVVRVLPDSAIKPLPRDYRTRTGFVVGTPLYVSPEGAKGRQVDQRADLYGAGLVLYYMLVARGPFDDFEEEHSILAAHASVDPEPPSRHSKHPVPPELDRALLKALAKNPDDRFQTAEEFRSFMEEVADHLRRPAGWLETTAYERPVLESPAPTTLAPAPSHEPTVLLADRSSPRMQLDEEAPPAAGPRISTAAASAWVAVVFILAALAAVGLVAIFRGQP